MPAVRISRERQRMECISRQEEAVCKFLNVTEDEKRKRQALASDIQEAELKLDPETLKVGHMLSFNSEADLETFCKDLKDNAEIVGEIALTEDPDFSSELISAYLEEMSKLVRFSDLSFNNKYILLMRRLDEAVRANDMTTVSDIFLYEIPEIISASDFNHKGAELLLVESKGRVAARIKRKLRSQAGENFDSDNLKTSATAQASMLSDESINDI